jgi:hypothetical protein
MRLSVKAHMLLARHWLQMPRTNAPLYTASVMEFACLLTSEVFVHPAVSKKRTAANTDDAVASTVGRSLPQPTASGVDAHLAGYALPPDLSLRVLYGFKRPSAE